MHSNRTVQTTSFNVLGKDVAISGYAEEYIYELVRREKRFYEHDLLDLVASLPLQDGLIVDIGANIGNHTVYFGVFLNNPIIAVEPVESNFELLNRNIRANRLEERVQSIRAVVWDRPGQFAMDNLTPSNGGTYRAHPVSPAEETISGETLSEIVKDRTVALLKVDVEGAEDKVIAGGLSVIRRDSPVIIAESHSSDAYLLLSELLLPEGYEIVAQAGRSTNYMWVHSKSLKHETVTHLRNRLEIDNRKATSRQWQSSLDRVARKINAMQSSISLQNLELLESTKVTSDRIDQVRNYFSSLFGEDDKVSAQEGENFNDNDTSVDRTQSDSTELSPKTGAPATVGTTESLRTNAGAIEDTPSNQEASRNKTDAANTLHSREDPNLELKLKGQLMQAMAQLERALDDRERFEIAARIWQSAYANLAKEWEESSPGALSAEAAMESVRQVISSRGGATLHDPTK